MALLFADSFEHYGTGGTGLSNMSAGVYLSTDGAGAQPTTTEARTGDRSFRLHNSTNGVGLRKGIITASNEVGVAYGNYGLSLTRTQGGFTLIDANASQIVSIQIDVTGAIAVRRGVWNGTLLGVSAAGVITALSWNHIEVRVLRDNVVGEIEVRVNGEVAIFLTNLDLGSKNVSVLGFYGWTSGYGYIDDLIIWDAQGDVNNDFFGPARVTTVWLAGDEPGNQWSVTGAATGAAALTETTPNGDTSYVSAAVVGNVSEFSIQSLPPEAEVIAGVYIPTMAKLAVAGIGTMQTSIVSGAEVEVGTNYPLTTAYTYRGEVFEKDPDTGQQWSKSGLEAALVRIEKTA